MIRHIVLVSATLAALTTGSVAEEIGYIEDFALATDRSVPLEQLIPGTEDYYYYHCLHYQNTEQWEAAQETLDAWIDRHKNYTPRVLEIENRQALLTYKTNPQRALDLIRRRLDLHFNHQREQVDRARNLPTQLDPQVLDPERLTKRAFDRHPGTLQGFEDAALERLATRDLNPEQRRHLLGRLTRPDLPNLAQIVVDDLNYKNSRGFGQFKIHRQLLLKQLHECLRLKPSLKNQTNFVHTYLSKLRPSDDANWRQDPDELEAYLDRLWAYVSQLDPVHNSLKAHVLYHRLLLDRKRGIHDAERFITYLKLPRKVSYIEPRFLNAGENRRFAADLQADFRGVTGLPIVGGDEPLVRSLLLHFLKSADDYEIYRPYVNDQYLKRTFAETKIVNGLGDPDRWYSLLTPAEYQALKERIDLDFAPTNKTEFAADEAVGLDLDVKNVETLIVKVFEINTQNYYRRHGAEVNTDINLDGLVANVEETYQYDEPPLRRVRRHFEFPQLNERGVYVIDFIGNGKSSRALIRKGKLRHLVRTSVAGQVFTVLDEENQPVRDATLWLAGTLYEADEDGAITTPFSNQPGRQPIVLTADGFSSLGFFQQESENYALDAAFYVDREELLSRRTAHLLVRPRLTVNGIPATLEALEGVVLVITSTDLDGISTTTEISDFELFEDRESTHEFLVPHRLASITFSLKATIEQQSRNKKVDLEARQKFAVNEIDRTEKTEGLHFTRVSGDYVIDVLGKSGEPLAGRPIRCELKHRDYRETVKVVLQSDAIGRVRLGPLPGVESVSANGPQGQSYTWAIRQDKHNYPHAVHGVVGEPITLPWMSAGGVDRSGLSLLELRGGTFLADRFAAAAVRGGLLQIDDLPAGDYSLRLKHADQDVRVRITAGAERGGYVLGDYRKLQRINPQPLQMETPTVGARAVRVRLRNTSPFTRVHVLATRYRPAFSPFGNLGAITPPEPSLKTTPLTESRYIAGRNIGDEFRYIIDRRFGSKYPGNMLDVPSVLLNPWAVRSTETGEQLAAEGEAFGVSEPAAEARGERGQAERQEVSAQQDFSNLDFLATSAIVMANLAPDDEGFLEIPREDLARHQQVTIVAVDPQNTASRLVSLPAAESDVLDLRLARGLDPARHYTQQKRISVVSTGNTLELPDITSSRFEAYDSLAKVYALYATLNPSQEWTEFGFLLDWPNLEAAEQREKYSKYACHELDFFLLHKDPEFFANVVQPYLANKRDPRFLDRWLLEENLDDYVKPWNFDQLNTFERILLGRRLEDELASVRRFVDEQFALIPPDAERFDFLFNTAIKGSALEADGRAAIIAGAQVEMDFAYTKELLATDQPAVGGDTDAVAPAAPAPAQEAAKPLADRARRKAAADDKLSELGIRRGLEVKVTEHFFSRQDLRRRERVLAYYQKLDKTKEWVENRYYHVPLERQTPELIAVNAFWRDYANHDPAEPFYSVHLAEATRNLSEMLLALTVLDLPFTGADHDTRFDGPKMAVTAESPLIAFHEEILPAERVAAQAPLLVSENFFRHGDRYRRVNNEQIDKFVVDEFLTGTVYGCHIVVTNPTSSRKKLDVLLQIPVGALPVLGGQATRSAHLQLDPYHTQTLEYYFYFPAAGDYAHYPVQAAADGEVLAFAAPFTFKVVDELTQIDKESWDYISQFGSGDDVLEFLRTNNIQDVNLDRIAFRMSDRAFFEKTVDLLAARHVYNHTLWSYGVRHDEPAAIREFLQHADSFVAQCGDYLDSPLLAIDPVARRSYEHKDYRPLVNARVGQLGAERQILNDRLHEQYHQLLKILGYRRQLSDQDLLAVTYYMLLQDRVDEAFSFFGRINPERLKTRMQYDYFTAYLDFYGSEPQHARQIAAQYSDHPVDRWRNAFVNVVNQADEIENPEVQIVDAEDRTQVQTGLAAATPAFDLTVEDQRVRLDFQNLDRVQVNYYLMDVELLFSRNPFVQRQAEQFSYILPNTTQLVELPADQAVHVLPLPEKLLKHNVLVEVEGAGLTRSAPYYSNALRVQMVENYGQLRVTQGEQPRPLPQAYVKVYARLQNGQVKFYKDGYTDLRGRFDYTSLNTNELDHVEKFALLILSDEYGAVVREANPPKR